MSKAKYKMDPRVSLEADEAGGGGILFDSYTATICTCNQTAWALLESLQNGAALDDLCKILTKSFEVEKDIARRDTVALLKELSSMDLVHEQS